MTWIELLYWSVLTPLVFVGVIAICVAMEDAAEIILMILLMILYFGLSILISTFISDKQDYKETSSKPINIAHGQIFGDTLIILTEGGKRLEFKDYGSIAKWGNGEPLVQTTYFKKVNFGWDDGKTEYTFK